MIDSERKRRIHNEMIERMTRQINEIGSGRRQPDRPEATRDGPFSRVRMVPDSREPAEHGEPCLAADAPRAGV